MAVAAVAAVLAVVLFTVGFPLLLRGYCSSAELNAEPPTYELSIRSDEQVNQSADLKHGARPNRPPFLGHIEANGRAYSAKIPNKPDAWSRRFWCEVNSSDYFIGLFTLILAIATSFLWWSTHRLWVAGERQARGARKALELANKQFIAAYRPRLRVRLVMLHKFGSHRSPVVHFIVSNVGDSEALDIEALVTFEVSGEKDAKKSARIAVASVLAPGEPAQVNHAMNTVVKERWKTENWGDGGTARIYGTVTYRDQNKVRHRTGFYRFSTRDLHRFRLPTDKDVERDYEYED